MANFQEVTKPDWEFLCGKYGYKFKSELPTNTYTDTYVTFNMEQHEITGRIRRYQTGGAERYYIWR